MTKKATSHPLWRRWCSLRNQIYNPRNHHYKYYGGRGIDIDPRWDHFWTFANEVEALIGPLPFPGALLDRIDNDRGYWPDNICWSTPRANSNNRQSSLRITAGNETHTLAEWARRTGIKSRTLWSRIYDLGQTPEQALGFNI